MKQVGLEEGIYLMALPSVIVELLFFGGIGYLAFRQLKNKESDPLDSLWKWVYKIVFVYLIILIGSIFVYINFNIS